eukprot:COSAG01_NODE_1262_length_10999_cov_12.033853_6_plen_131_part_00
MGIVLDIIVPTVEMRFADVFNRRLANSLDQDPSSPLPGPLGPQLKIDNIDDVHGHQYKMVWSRLRRLVQRGVEGGTLTAVADSNVAAGFARLNSNAARFGSIWVDLVTFDANLHVIGGSLIPEETLKRLP